MPFKSEAQRRLLWAKRPDIAQKWVDEGAKSKGLPMHVGDHGAGGGGGAKPFFMQLRDHVRKAHGIDLDPHGQMMLGQNEGSMGYK